MPKGLSLESVRISCPVLASRRLTVLAEFSVASQRPSRLKAIAWTSFILLPMVLSCSPVDTSQDLTLWSQLPDASRRPSGLNATAVTQPECPLRVRSSKKSGGEVRLEVTGAGTAAATARIGGFTEALRVGGSKGSSLAVTVAVWFLCTSIP